MSKTRIPETLRRLIVEQFSLVAPIVKPSRKYLAFV